MGKDEHKRKSRKPLGQTPKNEQLEARDVEFAEDIADSADLEAQRRSQDAEERARQQQNTRRKF
ncbi:YfhD family protein [Alkalibacillus silvisoli]|uniref:YfhD family protein n=1 Tax=Alkalibacillus silvisoli TaxID=392823 RepID=A0ABP3JHZ0_9BACI